MNSGKRLAIVDPKKCKPKKCNQECRKVCPVERQNKKIIEIEDIATIDERGCVGCGMCANPKGCPFKAIQIVNLPTALEKESTFFQYGENEFHLYRLPLPTQNRVYGIIGSNGCGKSTILKILNGKLSPNSAYSGIRGTQLQSYLEKLPTQEVMTKPQDVEFVQNWFKQKHPDVLASRRIDKLFDSNNLFHQEVVDTLDLNALRNSKVVHLSGGEMQRWLCGISLLTLADIYIFDEPSNFLDIEQRIKVAHLIQKLRTNGRFVILVEHDLSILDYTSDTISIVYGVPSAYGVISQPHSTSEAINMFFEGYIPSENMRIRTTPLTFKDNYTISSEEPSQSSGMEYSDFTVTYPDGTFSLTAEGGFIPTNASLVVLMGKNGTGKTTFLNYLSKTLGMKVCYKPQYIDFSEVSSTVSEFLYTKIRASMVSRIFTTEVVKPLGVDLIMDRKLSQLSGGEKQCVAIVLCLGQKGDIYFLDEPSASLDVEKRLNVTRVIKRFMIHNQKLGLVVEHDITMAMSLGCEPTTQIIHFEKVGDSGRALKCVPFKDGIDNFLKSLGVTFRTDRRMKRPRINKLGSQKDTEQKASGKYFV